MKHNHLGILLFILSMAVNSMAEANNKKTYCNLKKAPQDAVVFPTHGVSLLIFPKPEVVDSKYSGCQNIWLENGFLLAQAKYLNGNIQTFTGQEPDGSRHYVCKYRKRKLVYTYPSRKECPSIDYFPIDGSENR